MSDYAKYRHNAGITNNDMIAALRENYEQFSKIQCSMINHPEKYGLCLTKEAERVIAEKYGYYKGLDIRPKRISQVKLKKSKRLAVVLSEEDYDKAKNKMQEMGCTSVQSFLEALLTNATREEN